MGEAAIAVVVVSLVVVIVVIVITLTNKMHSICFYSVGNSNNRLCELNFEWFHC